MSTYTPSGSTVQEVTHYGGLVDAVGGIATIVLAIIALAGVNPTVFVAITTIVFGAALLIQGGAMLSEYTHTIFPAGTAARAEEFAGSGGLSTVFLAGAAGIVLGVLALLGIQTMTLVAVAVIAFGGALVVSSNGVAQLYRMKQMALRTAAAPLSGAEILASEIASGSAAIQGMAGLAAIVLGILAVTGMNATALILVALLVLGATVLLTGSTLSGVVMGFTEPAQARRSSWSTGPAE